MTSDREALILDALNSIRAEQTAIRKGTDAIESNQVEIKLQTALSNAEIVKLHGETKRLREDVDALSPARWNKAADRVEATGRLLSLAGKRLALATLVGIGSIVGWVGVVLKLLGKL